MRKAFLIFFLLIFVLGISQNNIALYSASGQTFKAYLNGNLFNQNAQASVLIEGVEEDTVNIKVEFENKATGGEFIYLLDKGKPVKQIEFNYSVEEKANKVKITFAGTKEILKLPNPLIPPKPIVDTTAKYRNNVLGHYCELKNGNAVFFNNTPKTGECKTPMPAEYLNYFNILMKKTQIEDDKFSLAENTTKNNCINVAQLNKILAHITFEIEKIKLIKLSYSNLTDKQNIKNLDSTFKLESSKRELASILKNAKELKNNSGVNCLVAANENDMSKFYSEVSIYSNDTEKFNYLKKKYVDLCYSANQAKLLLGLFIHDREKLEAAKLLYFYCTEKENFSTISDVFSYTTTAADLKEFVAKQKN